MKVEDPVSDFQAVGIDTVLRHDAAIVDVLAGSEAFPFVLGALNHFQSKIIRKTQKLLSEAEIAFKNTFFASRFLSMEINHFLNNNYTYPDKAKLLANCTLSLRIKKGGARNFRKVFVSNNNKESEFNIKEHLIVDDSVEGAWQAFIFQSYIDKINSIKLYFLFSKDDVKSVKTLGNEDLSLELQNYDITPYVGKYKNKYFISYCTFSQWGGLIRQNIEITLANNRITTYRVFQGINIYSYDCGFMI